MTEKENDKYSSPLLTMLKMKNLEKSLLPLIF